MYTDRILSMSVCIHGQKSCQELERMQICVISYVIISVKTQTDTDRYIYLHVSISPAPPGLSEHYSAPVFQRHPVSKMCTDCIQNVSVCSTQYTGLQQVRPCGRTWGTPYHPCRSAPTGGIPTPIMSYSQAACTHYASSIEWPIVRLGRYSQGEALAGA